MPEQLAVSLANDERDFHSVVHAEHVPFEKDDSFFKLFAMLLVECGHRPYQQKQRFTEVPARCHMCAFDVNLEVLFAAHDVWVDSGVPRVSLDDERPTVLAKDRAEVLDLLS